MKASHHLTKFVLLLLLINVSVNVQAQVRLGGSTPPHRDAVLDLNPNDTAVGKKGVLLPRVALRSSLNPHPLSQHTAGMEVYNTAQTNDVWPGLYLNDGTRWHRIQVMPSQTKQYTIDINDTIGIRSVVYYGTLSNSACNMRVPNVSVVFSDDLMRQTVLTVTKTARNNEKGDTIDWVVRIGNSNFDPNKTCILEKVVISYIDESDDHPDVASIASSSGLTAPVGYTSTVGGYIFVGQ
jgi:hypothetical protein